MDIEETTEAEGPELPQSQQLPQRQNHKHRPRQPGDKPDETFNEWVTGLSGGAKDYRVKIERTDPSHDDSGTRVDGWLAELEDFSEVDEMYLRNRWGGGRFVIHVFQRAANGKWQFARRFPVKIAGEPKAVGSRKVEALQSTTVPVRDEKLQEKAMDHSMALAKAERERADRLEEKLAEKGDVPAWALQLLNAERERADALARRIEALAEKANEPKPDTTGRYLEILIAQGGQQTMQMAERHRSELEAQARTYEAQLRATNDHHQRQLDSMREEHKRAVDQLQRANDLVVNTMTTTHAGQISAMTVSHQGQVNLLQAQLEGLKNERDELKRRLEKLQDEKKKGLKEMIEELGSLKEGMEALGIGGGEEQATWEKVVDKVGDIVSPIGKAFARGPAAMPPQPMPPHGMVPAPGMVPPGAAPPAPMPPVPPGFDPNDIPRLVEFIESAISAQQKPDVFARSAGSMVPAWLLEAFSSDPDAFADEVVKHAPSSIIGSPRGRLFLRKVAGHLSGRETQEVAAQ